MGQMPARAGLSKLGLTARSWHGRRGARAPGGGRWGRAGTGCSWERPEHSLQTDSAARRPEPAYLPPLGEGVGRRVGQRSACLGPGGPGEGAHLARLAPPTAGAQDSKLGAEPTVGHTVPPAPQATLWFSSSWPPLLWGAPAAKRFISSNLGLPFLPTRACHPSCLRGSAQATPSRNNQAPIRAGASTSLGLSMQGDRQEPTVVLR